jgi:hypothetical protein
MAARGQRKGQGPLVQWDGHVRKSGIEVTRQAPGRSSFGLFLTGLLAATTLAACGGGAESESDRTAQTVIQPDAQAAAEEIVLKIGDFPDGWRATPADQEDEAGQDEFNDCIGADFSEFTINGEAESDDFASGEATQASSQATLVASEEEASDAYDKFAAVMDERERMGECLDELLRRQQDDVEFGEVELGQLSFKGPDVEQAGAWQATVTGEAEGVSVDVYMDFVALQEGRAISIIFFLDVFSPFDSELRSELVEAVADRMNAV